MHSFSNESFTCFFIGDHSDHLKKEQRFHPDFGPSQKVEANRCATSRGNNFIKKRSGRKDLKVICRESQPSISSIRGINSKSSCCHLFTYDTPHSDLKINTLYSARTLISESVSQINMPGCQTCKSNKGGKDKKDKKCILNKCGKYEQAKDTKKVPGDIAPTFKNTDDLPTSDTNWPTRDEDVFDDAKSELLNDNAKKLEKGVQSSKAPTTTTETQCDIVPPTSQPSTNSVSPDGVGIPLIVVNPPHDSGATFSQTEVSRKPSGTQTPLDSPGDKGVTSDISSKPSRATGDTGISDDLEGPSSSSVPKEFRPYTSSSKSTNPNLSTPNKSYEEIGDLKPIIKQEALQNSQRHVELLQEISEMKRDINEIKALIANSKGHKWKFPCKKNT